MQHKWLASHPRLPLMRTPLGLLNTNLKGLDFRSRGDRNGEKTVLKRSRAATQVKVVVVVNVSLLETTTGDPTIVTALLIGA